MLACCVSSEQHFEQLLPGLATSTLRIRVNPCASVAKNLDSAIPPIAPFLCSPRNSYTRKDFKSFRFSTYKQFIMLLKTNNFKPFRISRSTIFARNPFGFSTYIGTPGGRGGGTFGVNKSRAQRGPTPTGISRGLRGRGLFLGHQPALPALREMPDHDSKPRNSPQQAEANQGQHDKENKECASNAV